MPWKQNSQGGWYNDSERHSLASQGIATKEIQKPNNRLHESGIGEIKPGDMFKTSWGYDQTNYDFLVVIGLTKSGKSAICRMTKAKHVAEEDMGQTNALVPIPDPYGVTFKMKIERGYKGDLQLRGSYPFCQYEKYHTGENPDPERDKPSYRLDTFSKVQPGQVYHETNSMFGH